MSNYATENGVLSRLRDGVSINRKAAIIAALTVVIQAGAWAMHRALEQMEFTSSPDTQLADPSIGVGVVGIIIVESLLIVGLYRLWKRTPGLVKRLLKLAFMGLGLLGAVAILHAAGGAWILGLMIGGHLLDKLLERYDLDWLTFNATAVGLGILIVSQFGSAVAPVVVIPAMVLAMVWDHVAVNLSDVMGDLVEFSSGTGIPNYIIIPNGWTVDYEGVTEFMAGGLEDDGRPEGLDGIIGLGDFIFPATLTISAAVALGGADHLPVYGAAAGAVASTFVLSAASEKREGGVPALPWLNTGAIVGFLVGVVASGIPLLVALGVNGGASLHV